MRLVFRTLAVAAVIAASVRSAARAQEPTPVPTPAPSPAAAPAAPEATVPPGTAEDEALPVKAPPPPSTSLRIVETPALSIEKMPAQNPYGSSPQVPAALPPKLAFTDAVISSGFFVSLRVDPTGKMLTARRDRDPIPSLAGESLKSFARWTFTPARRGGQAVDTWGVYRLELAVEVDAPKILQQSLSVVTPTTPIPAPFSWPPESDWLDGRKPAMPADGTVSILEVDTAPVPQKTPWSADSFKGPFSVKLWVQVDKNGRVGKLIPIEVSDPVLLPYLKRTLSSWTLRPAQFGGAPVESWNELFLSGQISYDVDVKEIKALRRAI